MLTKSIERCTEELHNSPVPASITEVMGLVNLRNQEELWVEIDCVPVFSSEEDKSFYVCSTFTDIEERKRTEKALSDIARNLTSTSRFESFISSLMFHLARIFGGGLRTSW